jgi:hypothetical protein
MLAAHASHSRFTPNKKNFPAEPVSTTYFGLFVFGCLSGGLLANYLQLRAIQPNQGPAANLRLP